ncbi:3-oxoacyl-ACP reductase [Mesorhizobium sp. Root554]|uniref:SDR family NAD(P)-dependent oxidoreductase n=1 Tax=unclassified Mesorhizobium TaxID=325217 RepID=UPI0006F24C30|nr:MULTISPECIES: SDR family oxidoreductase [unclassified Mesorhizobium]KQZ14732.1 3-oxoacyl-ACP reductase [Mesorhizobium sp. Root1471]KQZ37239.1 3-oxoacyl-ACP reductase [Mesorhizobium sp. Root554]
MYLRKFDLSGRVAVVTGAGRNIGYACADALSEAGAHVVLTDLDEKLGQAAVSNLAAMGRKVEFRRLDVTDPDETDQVAASIAARLGRVDILVANAGISSHSPAEEMSDADWLKVTNVNLNGVFWSNRAFANLMLKAGKGSIVNIGSMSGIIANRPQPQASYNASKGAVHMLTKSLAAEWAERGVRVNAVAPTYIATDMTRNAADKTGWDKDWLDMTPMKRMGEVEEIASVVLFLASDAASLMTGSIVVADAGYTSW